MNTRTSTSMFYDVGIPLWTIMREFEHIGTPYAVYIEDHRTDPKSRKITLCFETERQAIKANELKITLMKQNKLKRRTKLMAGPSRESIVTSPKKKPMVKSEVHEVTNTQHKDKPSKNRLFCLLPWEGKDKEKDEAFFRHFAQFGTMMYYETVRDKKGRLSYGYVQYIKDQDAERARKESDPIYKATFAVPRKLTRTQVEMETKFHPHCKREIDLNLYNLHEATCKKQAMWTNIKDPEREPKIIRTPTLDELKNTLAYLEKLEEAKSNQKKDPKSVPEPQVENCDKKVTDAIANDKKQLTLEMDQTNTYFISRIKNGNSIESICDEMNVNE